MIGLIWSVVFQASAVENGIVFNSLPEGYVFGQWQGFESLRVPGRTANRQREPKFKALLPIENSFLRLLVSVWLILICSAVICISWIKERASLIYRVLRVLFNLAFGMSIDQFSLILERFTLMAMNVYVLLLCEAFSLCCEFPSWCLRTFAIW